MDANDLRKELERQKQLQSLPIDFAQLERDGLLRQVRMGGVTYEVPNVHALPEHVRAQAVEISSGPNGTGTRIKFRKGAGK